MKLPAVITTLSAVLLALAPVARTHAQDAPPPPDAAAAPAANFDLFYNNLADDGDWYNTPEYGYVWQPTVATKSDKWRPYSDGYWAQTDDGWTWVSYENFGWATYHYGRWTRLNDLGWAWVPGYEWGPGWVSWRTNNDYVGWAPLPPQRESVGFQASAGGPGASVSVDYNDVENENEGYTPAVDAQFDIGPQNYCFVDCRHFGAPVLSEVLLPPQQNFVILQNTTNVTNIYYGNEGGRRVIYNRGGPDYNFISTRVDQPIQRLRLEQNVDPNYLRGNHPAGFNPTQVRGGVLQVAAPTIARGPVNFQQVKPPRVKSTLAKAEVVHGWSGASANPQAVQAAREQVKQQAQAVPKREANGNIAMPARPASKTPVADGRPKPPATVVNPAAVKTPAAPTGPAAVTDPAAARKAAREQQRVARPGAPTAPAEAQPAERPQTERQAPVQPERPAQPAAPKPAAPAPVERAARPTAPEPDRAARPAAPERTEPQHAAPATAPERGQPEHAVRPAAPERAEPQHAAPATAPERPRPEHAAPAAAPERPRPEHAAPAAAPERATPEHAAPAPAPERAARPAAPEPKPAAQREPAERAPEAKAPAPREQERAAKPEATHREEAGGKPGDDDKKKKKDQPQQ